MRAIDNVTKASSQPRGIRLDTMRRRGSNAPLRPVLRLALVTASVLALAGCAMNADKNPNPSVASPTSTVLKAVRPAAESVTQDDTVRLQGVGLATVRSVQFGASVARVLARSATMLTVKAPPADDYQPQTVPVILKSATGAVVAREQNAFTYVALPGVSAQLSYALAHWDSYNTQQYGNLNADGGDCANFVSQTLVARGWAMNNDWYNNDAGQDASPAWAYVPAMDEYFTDNASALGLQRLSFDATDRSRVSLGDIGVFYWGNDTVPDHVEVVDKIAVIDGVTHIYFASHNDDYAYRDLDQTIDVEHPGSTGHIWHLTR